MILLISIPYVQTQLGRKITNSINKQYKTNINVGEISLNIFGNISLKNIYIEDHHKDTLANIGSLNTSLLNFKKISEGDLIFNDIKIDNLNLIIKTYKNEKDTSLDVFIASFLKDNISNKKTPSVFLMTSRKVDIFNSRFRFINLNNYKSKILDFNKINIFGKELIINGPNVSVFVDDANMIDFRGIKINHLSTNFSYSLSKMNFDAIKLKTNTSELNGDLNFSYKRTDFSDFNNKVNVNALFNKSKISYEDLNSFYNGFGEGVLSFTTKVSGTFNNLKLPNLDLKTLNNTIVKGDLTFKNLLSKKEKFELIANVADLQSTYTDLKNMLPKLLGKSLPSYLRNIGVFSLSGKTNVTKHLINVDVGLKSSLGDVNTILKLDSINSIENILYDGKLEFNKFNLGKLLQNDILGLASFKLDLNGKSFALSNMDSKINGVFNSININNYSYNGISLITNVKKNLLDLKVRVLDENLKFSLDGSVDMSSKINKYDFISKVNFADLNKLNIIKRDSISIFKGDIGVKIIGSGINDLTGFFKLNNAYYKNKKNNFYLNDTYISSEFDDQKNRTISFNAPSYISGSLKGKFKFEELIKLAENDMGIIYTNYTPLKVSKDQYFDFNIKIENNFSKLFYPDIVIDKKAFLKGKVSSIEEDFKLNLKSTKIAYKQNIFNNVNIQLDNSNPFYNAFIKIKDIKTNLYNLSDFNLVNKTISDTLFFRTEFKGGKENNDDYKLNLYLANISNNKSTLGFKKSTLNINDYQWFINEFNDKKSKIVFDNNYRKITLEQLVVSHKSEYLKLYGQIENENKKEINLEINDVNLSKLLPEIKHFNFKGIANGNLRLLQDKGIYKPIAKMNIIDFNINNRLLGLFNLDITGNDKLNIYNLFSSIENENLKSFEAKGNLDFNKSEPNLNLDINLNKLDLSFFSDLGQDVITNIRGYASGKTKLFGKYNNPDFLGNLYLENAGIQIPYLNIDLDFINEANISLKNRQFIFNNIFLNDTKYNTIGNLNGFAAHKFFTDWELDLNITTDNLLVLDKKQEEESLYYGKAFIEGSAKIVGPTSNLLVKVNAKTNEGTVFKIPINDSESVGDNSFIKTVSKYDRFNQSEIAANLPKELNGLELEFDLDVTPDAEIEIVLDQEAGSVLKGRGSGLMRIEINTNDKFNMYGDFIVSEGTYNFVYGNNFLQGGFIEKRFKVKPGGTINWDGSPFKARLNMDAVYSASANPALLLDNPSINRKIPVDVIINLNGGLMQPEVNFNIEFPKTNSVVKSELLYKLDDTEFRDKQALSLVTTGQFTGSYAYGQGAVTGNLVERATSLVNNMLNNADDKFKIGLNYEQGENNPLEEQRIEDRLGFTITTQISDKILINGKVGIPVGGVSKTVVAGDVQVEFLLNGDGTLRAKIFNRENDLSQITTTTSELGYTQGVGISYKVDFDSFEELIQKIFKGKNKIAQEKLKELESPDSFIKTQPKTD
ncbi:translocation/assembly module TamB [Flavobacteriaceae bacterium]|nr:translocation/assembly module TamB [Flavobacteriaceae bacterium]